jgi:hypothetical protein
MDDKTWNELVITKRKTEIPFTFKELQQMEKQLLHDEILRALDNLTGH